MTCGATAPSTMKENMTSCQIKYGLLQQPAPSPRFSAHRCGECTNQCRFRVSWCSRYVAVGCDGGRSVVRKAAGMETSRDGQIGPFDPR